LAGGLSSNAAKGQDRAATAQQALQPVRRRTRRATLGTARKTSLAADHAAPVNIQQSPLSRQLAG
jgi:hypothetical protein